MPLTDLGKETLASLVIEGSATPFNATTSMLGVGNSNTAFNPTQTDLVGPNKARVPMDSGYPKIDEVDPSIMVFRSTFDENTANFEWNEWGLFNSGPSDTGGTMLVRAIENVGLKVIGSKWVFTAYVKFL